MKKKKRATYFKIFYVNKKGQLFVETSEPYDNGLSDWFVYTNYVYHVCGKIVKYTKSGFYLEDWILEKK